MNNRHQFTVDGKEPAMRLDAWLARRLTGMSRTRIQQLIRSGSVTINALPVKESHKIRPGERIAVDIPPPKPVALKAEEIPLAVLFEDNSIIVIDKPAGLVVHPAAGHDSGTLVNALLYYCPGLGGIGGELRPGIVHRLDKDTSGVIVVAKTENAMVSLAKQFKQREIHKEYLAVVWDTLSPPSGTIRTMIGRHLTDRKKMTATTQKGRLSITRYETVETYKKSSLVRLFPETGRTHQIRVHLAHLQHPVMGDRQYGRRPARELPFFAGKPHGTGPSARLTARLVGARRDRLPPVEIAFLASQGASPVEVGRQMLHAHKISLCHPETGKKMEFAAPLPEDMKLLLDYLRRKD